MELNPIALQKAIDDYDNSLATMKLPDDIKGLDEFFKFAMTSAITAYLKHRLMVAGSCPFAGDHEFDVDDPCPVCGMLGHFDAEDKCEFPKGQLREYD